MHSLNHTAQHLKATHFQTSVKSFVCTGTPMAMLVPARHTASGAAPFPAQRTSPGRTPQAPGAAGARRIFFVLHDRIQVLQQHGAWPEGQFPITPATFSVQRAAQGFGRPTRARIIGIFCKIVPGSFGANLLGDRTSGVVLLLQLLAQSLHLSGGGPVTRTRHSCAGVLEYKSFPPNVQGVQFNIRGT